MIDVSVILPIYNESKNIPILFSKLVEVLKDMNYEIVAVNDGSRDDSWQQLKSVAAANQRVRIINFAKNFGQTAALNAGLKNALGEIIVLIDSDLENDPSDIPLLLDRIREGYDVVSGWRQKRWKGQWLTRKLPSVMANRLISKISGVKLHDYGCTLKAYRREVVKDIALYGEMHRFIPVYASWYGGKVTELPVNYQPRIHGKSNYGIARTYKVILDLILIRFLQRYHNRPIHFFGGAGFISLFISFLSFMLAVYYKLTGQKDFVETPLPLFSAIFFVVGILMIMLGINAEIQMRTYYESQQRESYLIKEKVNFH
jgi:glycosyltransferase involved in cell wall biosynthesis